MDSSLWFISSRESGIVVEKIAYYVCLFIDSVFKQGVYSPCFNPATIALVLWSEFSTSVGHLNEWKKFCGCGKYFALKLNLIKLSFMLTLKYWVQKSGCENNDLTWIILDHFVNRFCKLLICNIMQTRSEGYSFWLIFGSLCFSIIINV